MTIWSMPLSAQAHIGLHGVPQISRLHLVEGAPFSVELERAENLPNEIQIDRHWHRDECAFPSADRLLQHKQLHRAERDRHNTTSNQIDFSQFFSGFTSVTKNAPNVPLRSV